MKKNTVHALCQIALIFVGAVGAITIFLHAFCGITFWAPVQDDETRAFQILVIYILSLFGGASGIGWAYAEYEDRKKDNE